MSKLTVIIPLLEKCSYLSECIASIAAQNLQIIDVLIVRDFEDEEVEKEIDGYTKEYSGKFPIAQAYCDEERGLAAVRNYGLTNCKGEYVYFMEPEDTLENGTFQALLDAVPNLPVPLVYSQVKPKNRLVSGYHEEYEEELELLFETDTARLERRPAMDQAAAAYHLPAVQYMVELRDNLEDFTVLGCMFYRNFLKENDILFSTSVQMYPDAPFICKVLINAEQTEAVKEGAYIRRNGTFRYAVERRYNWMERLEDYVRCYDQAYGYCTSNLEMMLLVQETMCSRYVNVVTRALMKSKNRDYSESIYQVFARQMKRVDSRVVASFGRAERKHLKLLLKGNFNDSMAYMKPFIKKKKREFLFKKKNNWMRKLAEKLFGNMDIMQRCILFESGEGERYYGDPKYIYQYLQNNYPGEYRFVWVVNDNSVAQRIDGKRKIVKKNTLMYYNYVLRAKYWVKDTRQPIWWYKAPEQVYISTWLGTPMQKLFWDKTAFVDGDRTLQRGLKAQVEQWDVVISGNGYTTKCLESGLRVKPEQILQIGNPRNDILVAGDAKQHAQELKESMGLPLDKKILLYAPVWREEEETDVEDCYMIQLGLHRIKEQLGDSYIILIRVHEAITEHVILDKALEGFVYDVTPYDDLQELMLISDYLITDYSSIVFDYACLRRPIFFYLYDYEEYQKKRAHFYFEFEEDVLPGPYCKTTQEIINYLKDIEPMQEEYRERYDRFYARYCTLAGQAGERLARRVFEEMADIFEYEDEQREQS